MQLHHCKKALAFSDSLIAETKVRKENLTPTSKQGKVMQGKITDHYHVITAGKKRDRFHMQIPIELKDPVKAQLRPS